MPDCFETLNTDMADEGISNQEMVCLDSCRFFGATNLHGHSVFLNRIPVSLNHYSRFRAPKVLNLAVAAIYILTISQIGDFGSARVTSSSDPSNQLGWNDTKTRGFEAPVSIDQRPVSEHVELISKRRNTNTGTNQDQTSKSLPQQTYGNAQ